LAKEAGIKRFGIHMMTGSNNLEPYYFAEIVDKLLTIIGKQLQKLDIMPEYVDIGGGLGIPYEDYEEELDLEKAAQLITETFNERCERFGFEKPALILEPGRFLVANAGWLAAKVTGIKKSYKAFVGLNAGMNTLIRPALYGAKHRAYVYGKESNREFVNICGQICENSDIFAHHYLLPAVEEGDIVIFRDAGAYGYVMASNYNNRLRPAEVLVDGSESKLIRRAETFDDVLRLYGGL
jgi:diaminopimelate decarboxylase